jgi:hypothetical protein
VFLDWNKSRYTIAFSTHLGCYVVLLATIIFLRFYLVHQNKLKDRIQTISSESSEPDIDDLSEGLADFTDKEQKSFRYVY